jgi:hypothetical protein
MNQSPRAADILNQRCRCTTLDESALEKRLGGIIKERPNLFSRTMTFLSAEDFLKMKEFIMVAEKVLRNPEGPQGVFMGYDFHLTENGPKLIEINTNAGGAYLNLILAQSQVNCCPDENIFFNNQSSLANLDLQFLEMFKEEWKLSGKTKPMTSVAIVDESPETQYLYPEFVLFRELFLKNGIQTIIAEPSQLIEKSDGLYFGEQKIDLIYNRLTDFNLSEERHSHLSKTWTKGAVVLTPSPHHHATHAHKKHLSKLSDPDHVSNLHISDTEKKILLTTVPKTKVVSDCVATELWSDRRRLFFKPVDGFGSRAAYRGDKITSKVWNEIKNGNYIAQEIVPPGQRVIAGQENVLKADIRAYTYQGQILLLAARLYEGQTTNFRTAGGGFSPVFVIAER